MAQALREVLDQRNENRKRRKEINKILSVIWKPGWADTVRTSGLDPSIVPSQVGEASELVYIRDKFMRGRRNFLSPFDASEGTLYLIFVATLLAHTNAPKCFALDNVDGTLNPRLVRFLLEHIVEVVCGEKETPEESENGHDPSGPNQVFFTSHNPTALDALDIFDPDHRIFVVKRNEEDGRTTFEPLLPPKNMTKSEWISATGGKNLSRFWLDERFPGALG